MKDKCLQERESSESVLSLPLQSLCTAVHTSDALKKRSQSTTQHMANYYQSVRRTRVPHERRLWSVLWTQYAPTAFELDFTGKSWADPPLVGCPHFEPKWNQLDGAVDRRSHHSHYEVRDGFPINPLGRTGLRLRGRLGRWGPNHAADAIVARWKQSEGRAVMECDKPVLQFVAVQRRDCGQWAIPGGMVDAGETTDAAMRREFAEEALAGQSVAEATRVMGGEGREVFRGCVADDPRNTDNAWMETVVKVFVVREEEAAGIALRAGDDAVGVQWCDVSDRLEMYANHKQFIEMTARLLGAYF